MERDGVNASRTFFVLYDFRRMLSGLSNQRRKMGIAGSTHAIDKNYAKKVGKPD